MTGSTYRPLMILLESSERIAKHKPANRVTVACGSDDEIESGVLLVYPLTIST